MQLWVVAITNKWKKLIFCEILGHPRSFKFFNYDDKMKTYEIQTPENYITLNQYMEYLKKVHSISKVQRSWIEHRIRCMLPPARIWIHKDSIGDLK